jgi:PAS domain S-box-containing protein
MSTPLDGHAVAQVDDAVFRQIVEQSLIGTFLIEDGRIVYANPRSAEIFGRSVEEMIGLPVDQVMHPDDRRSGSERLHDREAGATMSAPYSIRGLRPDGTSRELETQTALRTFGGRRMVMVAITDVTEARHTQRVLNQLAEAVGSKIGGEFFSSLVVNLTRTLAVDVALVSEVVEGGEHLRMIALAVDGVVAEPFTYTLRDSPCEAVLHSRIHWYPKDVRRTHPDAVLPRRLNTQSYAGLPLVDSSGHAIGVLAIMNRGDLPRERPAEAAIEVYAVRAATELERRRSDRAALVAKEEAEGLLQMIVKSRAFVCEILRSERVLSAPALSLRSCRRLHFWHTRSHAIRS